MLTNKNKFENLLKTKTNCFVNDISYPLETYLIPINKELKEVTKDKLFRLNGRFMWDILQGYRQKIITNLHEWSDDFSNFLIQIESSYLPLIQITKNKYKIANSTIDLKQSVVKDLENNLNKCFMDPKHYRVPCKCHIQHMYAIITGINNKTMNARNYSSHRYKKDIAHSDNSLEELQDLVIDAKFCIKLIHLLWNGNDPGLTYYDITGVNLESKIKDFVDLLLLGSIKQMPFIEKNNKYDFPSTVRSKRIEFYEKCHRRTDGKLFNDYTNGVFYD